MPRKARQKSESGIYHIIMRGINRQIICNEDEGYHRFLQALNHYNEISGYQIYAYCLMSNHIHLLMKIEYEPLEDKGTFHLSFSAYMEQKLHNETAREKRKT